MKFTTALRLVICVTLAVTSLTAFGQRINPKTQIKLAPGAGYILRSISGGALDFIIDTKVAATNSAPSGAPAAGFAPIHVNTSTGVISTWNGSAWTTVGGVTYTAGNGINISGGNAISLAQNGATTGQFLQWNGSAWVPANQATNLTYSGSSTTGTVNSDTGNDAIIPAATNVQAGLMTATDKTNFDLIDDQTGVPPGSTSMGTFTGTTIPDNLSIKGGLQSLETALEAGVSASNGLSGNGRPGTPLVLGGNLTGATTLDGTSGNAYNLTFTNIGAFRINAQGGSNAANSTWLVTNNLIFGITGESVNPTRPTRKARFELNPDNPYGLYYEEGNTSAKVGFLVAPDQTGTNSQLRVITDKVKDGTATVGQALTLSSLDGTVDFTTVSGGGGSSVTTYSAGNGAIVTATGTGVTFTRTTSSQWTMNIPSGVELLSFDINSSAAQSATSALDIDFVWAGTRPYNQDASVDLTDLKAPVITTVKKISPATYPTTAASNNVAFTLDVTAAGTLRLSTTEFAEIGGGGAQATSVKGTF